MRKNKIKRLLAVTEPEKRKSVLHNRLNYLKSKHKNRNEDSNQMKYIKYHLRRMGERI